MLLMLGYFFGTLAMIVAPILAIVLIIKLVEWL